MRTLLAAAAVIAAAHALPPRSSFNDSVPLFAHVRWANFSASDLRGLARFRSVTVQVEPDAPLPCEAQAQDVRARLRAAGAGGVPVLMYGNLFYSEPNCAYAAQVAADASLWLNSSDGTTPYRPAGRYTFDMSNLRANVSEWWAQHVVAAAGVDGGFGDSGCGGAPGWVNGSRAEAWRNGTRAAHALATAAAAAQAGSVYIVNCPILPQIGDEYIAGTSGEMIESWCSDFQPGGSGIATYCRDELLEALALSGWDNITLQARYYLNSHNAHNPQFGLAAFLVAAWHGAFFGASVDWNWAGDWASLLNWPWASLAPGEPLQPPQMLDKEGCAWARAYPHANVSIDLCSKHLAARIDWDRASGVEPGPPAPPAARAVPSAARAAPSTPRAEPSVRTRRNVVVVEAGRDLSCPPASRYVIAPWAAHGVACVGFAASLAKRSEPVVASALPAGKLAAANFSFNYSGFARFPSFYFGANEDGPQSPAQLAFISRFALAGWGWQQGYAASKGVHGEANGAAAAARLRAAYPACAGPAGNCTSPDATFVYRQSESLFTYYDLMAAVAANASLRAAATLHDPASGAACGGGGLLGFGNASFVNYWADDVGGELVAEAAVDGVFFDSFDKLYAPGALAAQGCPGFGDAGAAQQLLLKVNATAAQLRVLAAGQRMAIVSSYNFFANASAEGGSAVSSISGVSEDAYAAALAGLPWMRFYEVWMGHGAAQDLALLKNAMREVELGVPFVARTDVKSVKTLEYPAAAFLIAQGALCYWGASSGWLDADAQWHGEYEWSVGAPLGPAVQLGAYVFERKFERATVSVDLAAARGSVVPTAERRGRASARRG